MVHHLHLEGLVDDEMGEFLIMSATGRMAFVGVGVSAPAGLAENLVGPEAAILEVSGVTGTALLKLI